MQLEEQPAEGCRSEKQVLSSSEEIESLRAEVELSQAEAAGYAMMASNLKKELQQAQGELAKLHDKNRCLKQKYQEAELWLGAKKGNLDNDDILSGGSNLASVSDALNFDEACTDQAQLSSESMTRRTSLLERVSSSMSFFLQPSGSNESSQGRNLDQHYTRRRRSCTEIETIPRKQPFEVEKCKNPQFRRMNSCGSNSNALGSNSNALDALGSILLGRSSCESVYDEDLMKQLAILENAKKETESELELKLQQREAAISTLERTTQLQCQTISELRVELERLNGQLSSMTAQRKAETATLRGTMLALLSDEIEPEEEKEHNMNQGNCVGNSNEHDLSPRQIQMLHDELNRRQGALDYGPKISYNGKALSLM